MDEKSNLTKMNHSLDEVDDASSSCSSARWSASCSQDSNAATWENFIRTDGTVFYVEYGSPNRQCSEGRKRISDEEYLKSEGARKNSCKLPKLVGNKHEYDSTRCIDFAEGKEIHIEIKAGYHTSHSQLSTEAVLGIYTLKSSNSQQLIVSGFTKKHENSDYEQIRVGDILISINNINVCKRNIEYVLSQLSNPVCVVLKFKSFYHTNKTKQSLQDTSQQITSFESFSQRFAELLNIDPDKVPCTLFPVTLVVMDSSDTYTAASDAIFCYPPKESNLLVSIRGSLLTLISITNTELSSHPSFSSVLVDDKVYSVFYIPHGKVLILYCIEDGFASPCEGNVLANELMQYLRYFYPSISTPLEERTKMELMQICHVTECRITKLASVPQFEIFFYGSKLLPIPREAKMRIFDTISEMNAMDYRDWNEQPLLSHRNFFIYGSTLYYKSFLLLSHLSPEELGKIESFLRLRGIFDFIEERDVYDLVSWEEIPVTVLDRKFFLAVTSRCKLLLVVILQLFGPKTTTGDDSLGLKIMDKASLFFIEEMQGTLDHLHEAGIDRLAESLISSNRKPDIVECGREATTTAKFTEYLSIQKNRVLSPEKAISLIPESSLHSLTHSEESNQKVIEDDSDSDWDYHNEFLKSHQKHVTGLDMFEIKGHFFKDVCLVPISIVSRVTGEKNILLHYIYQDVENSIVISPYQLTMESTLSVFRSACHYIHHMLQSTLCKTTASNNAYKINRKPYMVMKEYGVLITMEDAAEDVEFWAIGRFFVRPKRRLYICNGSAILQSALEIALRLSFYC